MYQTTASLLTLHPAMTTFTIACELPLSPEDMWRIRATAGFRRHVVEYGLLKRLDCSAARPDKDGYCKRTQRYVPTKIDCPAFLRNIIGDSMFDVTDEQRWCDDDSALSQQFCIRPTHFAGLSCTAGVLTLASLQHAETQRRPRTLPEGSEIDASSSDSSTPNSDSGFISSDGGASGSDGTIELDSEFTARSSEPSQFDSIPQRERCVHVISGDTKVSVPGAGWLVERSIVHNLKTFYNMYPGCVSAFRQKLYDQFADGDTSVAISVVINRFLKYEEKTESVSGDSLELDANADHVYEYSESPFAETMGKSMGGMDHRMPFDMSRNLGGQMSGNLLGSSVSIEDELESFFISA